MRYTLIVTGDIEQAVAAIADRDLTAVIESAFYSQAEHLSAIKINGSLEGQDTTTKEADAKLQAELETWKAERGTTGQLNFYSPYWAGQNTTMPG